MSRLRLCAFVLALVALSAYAEEDPQAKALADLESKDYSIRIAAAKTLGGGKPAKPIVSALLHRLADPDWGVQIAALRALGSLADPEATLAVAKAAVVGDIFFVRQAALDAALHLDKNKAMGYFLSVAKSSKEDSDARVLALHALGAFADERLAQEFAGFAQEKDPFVRGESYRALGLVAKGKIGGALLEGLRSKGFAAQYGALQGIVRWIARDEKERSRGVAAVVSFLASTRPGYVLRRAREELGAIDSTALLEAVRAELAKADPEAKAYLVRLAAEIGLRDLLAEVKAFAKEKDEKLRAAAASALGNLSDGASDAATTDLLRSLLKDASPLVQSAAVRSLCITIGERIPPAEIKDYAPEVRLMAVGALGRAKEAHDEDLVTLCALLEDADWRVACAAAVALGRLFQEKALAPLEKLSKHADWRIRGAAVVGVGRILRKESIPPLLEALSDKHPIVQGAALKNLQFLTTKAFDLDPAKWKAWWTGAQDKFAPFNPGAVIKGLRDSGYGTREYVEKLFANMEIIVVSGSWDHVEEVLKDLKLAHKVIPPSALDKVHLNPRQILLLNCGSQVTGKSAEPLQWFVATGGYLMTTDWVIADTLEKVWPAYLSSYKKDSTNDDVVVTEPCSHDRLLRDVYAEHARTKIWLEIQSFGIQINNPYVVSVLVDSLELKQKYNLEAACVAFDYGLGRVFHSMSHFYLQKQSLQSVRTKAELKVFAVDHLGLDVDGVRKLDEAGDFDAAGKEPLSRLYPVFKVIVNFVDERLKRELGEE